MSTTQLAERPKRLIAWDTSSSVGVIVALEESVARSSAQSGYRVVVEWKLSLETSKHSERLLWAIDTVLESAGWKPEDLTAIGVGVGPGSFTGLRIGITTAKILASQLKVPLVPISSLALLARSAVEQVTWSRPHQRTWILALQDAAKGEWFTLVGTVQAVQNCVATADGDLPGAWARGVKERTLSPDALIEEAKKLLKKNRTQSWIATGLAVERYAEQLDSLPAARRIRVNSSFEPRALAQMTWEGFQQGILRSSSQIRPHYLRDSDAEVKLKKGLLKPPPLIHRTGIA